MARIRSIKPEFWRSPGTGRCSFPARLLYIAMWNWADDYGVGEWTPLELQGFAFPHDDDMTRTEFQCLCTEVADNFQTMFYVIGGRRFYCVPTWDSHQKNERKAQSKYPRPDHPDATSDQAIHGSTETHGNSVQTRGASAPGTGEQGNRGTGEQGINTFPPEPQNRFDEFWETYPRKEDKAKARIAFSKATDRTDAEEIIAGAMRYRDDPNREPEFTKHPTTWLNAGSWENEPLPPRRPTGVVTRQTTDDKIAATLDLGRRIQERENQQLFDRLEIAR